MEAIPGEYVSKMFLWLRNSFSNLRFVSRTVPIVESLCTGRGGWSIRPIERLCMAALDSVNEGLHLSHDGCWGQSGGHIICPDVHDHQSLPGHPVEHPCVLLQAPPEESAGVDVCRRQVWNVLLNTPAHGSCSSPAPYPSSTRCPRPGEDGADGNIERLCMAALDPVNEDLHLSHDGCWGQSGGHIIGARPPEPPGHPVEPPGVLLQAPPEESAWVDVCSSQVQNVLLNTPAHGGCEQERLLVVEVVELAELSAGGQDEEEEEAELSAAGPDEEDKDEEEEEGDEEEEEEEGGEEEEEQQQQQELELCTAEKHT
ncbi:hypothetical protein F7725_002568 [Dissostichus mawsoni]|uniref:Uncharacterized protein n=1 Tax=Dissostichus mawsoni TaxID=36200 RepID=A0A7J5Y4J2_DISMA|nr:hypothetical protein F7725_002568 [Dissostichus mawsoni]